MAVEVDQPAEVVVPVDRFLNLGGCPDVGVKVLVERAADIPVAHPEADHREVGVRREVGEITDRERTHLLLTDHLRAEVAQDLTRSVTTRVVVGADERARAGDRRTTSRPTVVEPRQARGTRVGARAHPRLDVLEGDPATDSWA